MKAAKIVFWNENEERYEMQLGQLTCDSLILNGQGLENVAMFDISHPYPGSSRYTLRLVSGPLETTGMSDVNVPQTVVFTGETTLSASVMLNGNTQVTGPFSVYSSATFNGNATFKNIVAAQESTDSFRVGSHTVNQSDGSITNSGNISDMNGRVDVYGTIRVVKTKSFSAHSTGGGYISVPYIEEVEKLIGHDNGHSYDSIEVQGSLIPSSNGINHTTFALGSESDPWPFVYSNTVNANTLNLTGSIKVGNVTLNETDLNTLLSQSGGSSSHVNESEYLSVYEPNHQDHAMITYDISQGLSFKDSEGYYISINAYSLNLTDSIKVGNVILNETTLNALLSQSGNSGNSSNESDPSVYLTVYDPSYQDHATITYNAGRGIIFDDSIEVPYKVKANTVDIAESLKVGNLTLTESTFIELLNQSGSSGNSGSSSNEPDFLLIYEPNHQSYVTITYDIDRGVVFSDGIVVPNTISSVKSSVSDRLVVGSHITSGSGNIVPSQSTTELNGDTVIYGNLYLNETFDESRENGEGGNAVLPKISGVRTIEAAYGDSSDVGTITWYGSLEPMHDNLNSIGSEDKCVKEIHTKSLSTVTLTVGDVTLNSSTLNTLINQSGNEQNMIESITIYEHNHQDYATITYSTAQEVIFNRSINVNSTVKSNAVESVSVSTSHMNVMMIEYEESFTSAGNIAIKQARLDGLLYLSSLEDQSKVHSVDNIAISTKSVDTGASEATSYIFYKVPIGGLVLAYPSRKFANNVADAGETISAGSEIEVSEPEDFGEAGSGYLDGFTVAVFYFSTDPDEGIGLMYKSSGHYLEPGTYRSLSEISFSSHYIPSGMPLLLQRIA